MKRILLLSLALVPLGAAGLQAPDAPDPFVGAWLGSLDVPGADVTLRLRFDVTRDGDGLAATLHSIDQGNAEIVVETVEADGSKLTMTMPSVGASFEGTLSEDGEAIDGTFTQMGAPMPLRLERMSEDEVAAAARRPQDPEEPFPYLAEEVTYPNPEGGHVLAGAFTRPRDGGPFPAVILISGSGPQDRDEALLGHRPFLVLSDHLTRRGIAVLRFDDRGVGKSTGDFAAATSEDFASDVLAGVAYLLGRDDVDPDRIGLAGHSEGGLIAPMAAVASDDIAYIVLMAGPGVNGERILYAQTELIGRAAGMSEAQLAATRKLQSELFAVLKTNDDPESSAPEMEALVRAHLEKATPEERAQAGVADSASFERAVATEVRQINSPWFRYFLVHEPAEFLERVTVPVLAVAGGKDLQVPADENLTEIAAALKRGGNTAWRTHLLPDHNHLFQRAETGAPSEYATIDETWSVESMELIADWVLETAGATARDADDANDAPSNPDSERDLDTGELSPDRRNDDATSRPERERDPTGAVFHRGDSLDWEDYGDGMRIVSLYGEPSEPGESFAFRLQVGDGFEMPPHTHPVDEHMTVLSGRFFVGLGETMDRAAAVEYGPGSYLVVAAGIPAFMWAEGETVVQVHGVGPFATEFVDPR